jgi:tRNA/rRNA methyltransferase
MNSLKDSVHVLLENPEGALNLGFIARAMANTGFARLIFTGNLSGSESEALKYALHASHILENSEKRENLFSLTSPFDVVFGFSPRNPWEDGRSLPFEKLAETVAAEASGGKSVGLLFGSEAHGLSNDMLAVCRYRVALPTTEEYVSMNLAQAVMVVLWELRTKLTAEPAGKASAELAGGSEKSVYLNKLRNLLEESGYLNEQNPEMRWREINLIYESRDWSKREISLLTSFTNQLLRELKALRIK